MKVVAVIPALNEAPRIEGSIRGVLPYVDAVVVVDDGSRDGTGDVARGVGVHVLRHQVNRGQGAGLRTGTDAALRLGADIIIHTDADGQFDPTCVPAVLQPLRDGQVDVVFGSRFLGEQPRGIPMTRKILLRGARIFNSLLMGIPRRVTDPQGGMRAFTKQAASKIVFRQDGFAHCSEILRVVTRSSLRWMEVPVRVMYSEETLAKGQRNGDAFRIVWKLFLGLFAK